jgi:2-phosphosulfolactate phosphatase
VKIDAFLSPEEFPSLAQANLTGVSCVVFDILRATSSIVTALGNGAECLIPVSEIAEAIARRAGNKEYLLAGERNGLKIGADLSMGIDFDFGNSPREFLPDRVSGKTICITTTNGTRALRSCAQAEIVLAASFLNLRATCDYLVRLAPANILLVCSGTFEEVAYEDVLAAGALCEMLAQKESKRTLGDSALIARDTFRQRQGSLSQALGISQNGRRLLARPELRDDVDFCAQENILELVAIMGADGAIRKSK